MHTMRDKSFHIARAMAVKAGIPEATAAPFAALFDKLGGDPFGAEEWAQVPGCEPNKKGCAANRKDLLRLTGEIAAASAAAAATTESNDQG
jgi:hypothetical protein